MATKTAVKWPKLEILGPDGQRERIVELSEAESLGISKQSIKWLKSGENAGTGLGGGREAFRYTERDATRDAAEDLLAALKEWAYWIETLPGGIKEFERFARKRNNWADMPLIGKTRAAIAKAEMPS